MSRLLRLCLAACLAAAPGAAQPQEAVRDSAAQWARYASGLAGDRLKADIAAFASPRQRRRLASARVVVSNRAGSLHSLCRYPTRLALSEEGDDGPRIIICSDNLRALNFMMRQWGTVHMMARQHYDDGRGNALYDYIRLVAGSLHEQRGKHPDEVVFPCEISYFLFLRAGNGEDRKCVGGAEASPAFREWMRQRGDLVDQELFNQYRRTPGAERYTDEYIRSWIQAYYLQSFFPAILVFATAHEFGHVANGDLLREEKSRCEGYRSEREADRFAIRFLATKGAERPSEVVLAQFPWFFLGTASRGMSGPTEVAEILAAARAKTMIEALRTDAAQLSRLEPNDPNVLRMKAAAGDPRLVPLLEQINRAIDCSG